MKLSVAAGYQMSKAEIDRDAALLFFGETIGINAGQGANQRRVSARRSIWPDVPITSVLGEGELMIQGGVPVFIYGGGVYRRVEHWSGQAFRPFRRLGIFRHSHFRRLTPWAMIYRLSGLSP